MAPIDSLHKDFLTEAIKLAETNSKNGHGPFGALIVKNGEILSKASNSVTETNDPTAHAEINAIRKACKKIRNFSLQDCIIYSSCEPCPMCLSAIYWARIKTVYFAATKKDAEKAGFIDNFIYEQFHLPLELRSIPCIHIDHEKAIIPFNTWETIEKKKKY